MTDSRDPQVELTALISRSPYLNWLGLEVLDLGEDSLSAIARWREEWVANPDIGQTQGGILAALIDFGADFALYRRLGRPVLTIDLRVDYHRVTKQSDLRVEGRVVRLGRQFSVCEAMLYDDGDKFIASGRGSFLTAET